MSRSFSLPVSPVVIATALVSEEPAGAASLDLLVLWRGEPGWFMKPGARSGGGRGSDFSRTERLFYGGVNLTVELIHQPRAVQILGSPVTLKPADANVLLVDRVDSAAGPTVAQTLRVDPSMPDGSRNLEPVLKRSSEIVAFMRCGTKLPDANAVMQSSIDRVCVAIGGGR